MATFILVHGTYAPQANWVAEGSPLRVHLSQACSQLGHTSTFIPIPWRGRNLGRDRIDAATDIKREVARIRQETPAESIFLIGHSHGGSAVAYFLRDSPEFAKLLAGVAFLSTPFLAMRPRTDIAEIVQAFMFMSALVMMTIVACIIGQNGVTLGNALHLPYSNSDSFFQPFSFGVFSIIIRLGAIAYAILVLLIYSMWRLSTNALVRLLRKRLNVAVK